ncbi:MAG: hypothetical protein V4621_07680 [Pseudomonadota bacterium]
MATDNNTASKPKSKAARAVAYMAENQVTVYAAAKAIGVDAGAVYRYIGKMAAMAGHPCPCCGQMVPPAQ